jgi:ribosome-binding factor A
MSKKYQRRVSRLIQRRLTTLLWEKASDPRLQGVTITGVDVTPDTVRADVHFSVLGTEEDRAAALAGLEAAQGWLRREIGRGLRIRNIPRLVFLYDPSLEHGEHISEILDSLDLPEEEPQEEPGADEG